MNERERYITQLQRQLEAWHAEIDALTENTQRARRNKDHPSDQRLTHLRAKCHAAREVIAELRASEETAWEQLREGAERTWGDLKQLFHETRTAFREGRQDR